MATRPKSPRELLDTYRAKMCKALDGKLREEFVAWGPTPDACIRTLLTGLDQRVQEGVYRIVPEWTRMGDQPTRVRSYDLSAPDEPHPQMQMEDYRSLVADNPYLVLSTMDDRALFGSDSIEPDKRYSAELLLQPGASLAGMNWEQFMQEFNELTPWDIVSDNRLARRCALPTAGEDDLRRIIRFTTNANKALNAIWQHDTVMTDVLGKLGRETVTEEERDRARDVKIDVEDEIYNLQSKLRTAQEATYHLIESAYAKSGNHEDGKDAARVRKLLEETGANPPLLEYLKRVRGIAQVNAAFGMREQLQHGKPAFSYEFSVKDQRMHLRDHDTGNRTPAYATLATHYEKVSDAIAQTVRLLYAIDMRTQLRAIYR